MDCLDKAEGNEAPVFLGADVQHGPAFIRVDVGRSEGISLAITISKSLTKTLEASDKYRNIHKLMVIALELK